MAKIVLNGYAKWVGIAITLAAICVAAGGMMQRQGDNCKRLDKVEPKVESQGKAIISMQSDIAHIKEGVDRLLEK